MLNPCPGCGRYLSDQADACPGCGHPISHRARSGGGWLPWLLFPSALGCTAVALLQFGTALTTRVPSDKSEALGMGIIALAIAALCWLPLLLARRR